MAAGPWETMEVVMGSILSCRLARTARRQFEAAGARWVDIREKRDAITFRSGVSCRSRLLNVCARPL